MKKLFCFLCAAAVTVSVFSAAVSAKADSASEGGSDVTVSSNENTYNNYCKKHNAVSDGRQEGISVNASEYTEASDGIAILETSEQSDTPVLKWESSYDDLSATWKINVPEIGKYRIRINYYALENTSDDISFSLKLNGEFPFSACEDLSVSKVWKNSTNDFEKDSTGNEERPETVQVMCWQSTLLTDKTGVTNEPYEFVFFAGENTITITGITMDILLKSIELVPPEEIQSYQSYKASQPSAGSAGNADPILIQCEKMTYRSNSAIVPMADRSHAEILPSDPMYTRYNTVGDYNWQTQGQWIFWEFTVEEPGYYNIGMRVRQNYQRGYATSRKVYIDGEVPFKELECVEFDYKRNWYFTTLGGEDPYVFYFDAGTHSVAMEVIPGETAELSSVLQESLTAVNEIYRSIIMITGTSPDMYRDYYLEEEIPGLVENMTAQRDILSEQYEKLQVSYGGRDSDTATLQRLIAQLSDFIDDPDRVTDSITTFSDNIGSLASWVVRMKEQPLEMDYIEIIPANGQFTDYSAGIAEKIVFSVKQFFASFIVDYNAIGDTADDEQALDIWVSLGRDQAQLIRELAENGFTKQYGIPVNIMLSKGSLIQAVFAGTGPDVSLFVASDQPVNLAVRDAVVDVSELEGADEVLSRFSDEELVAFQYDGGIYGIPLTADISMMFVRTDIFEQLGLEIPETWDDLYDILPTLQRNNMNVGLPKVTIDGLGFSVFNSLLLQSGQNYYTEDGSRTTFDTQTALDAFREWTGYYTKYDVPIDYDFYNRFRSGEIPIGIESYTLYNKLAVAAPEIAGMWTMVPMPGTEKEDGTIDRSTSISCTAAVILKDCENIDAAWKFLDWFSTSDVQGEYGRQIESIVGEASRYNTANFSAIEKLPWTAKEAKLILTQTDSAKGIPQSIASYYVIRNIYNAYRKVTVNNANPREVLYTYNSQMNDEIERKREEFGLDKEGADQ